MIRINKALADAGICSRRKADEYILNGKVIVNGTCLTKPGLYIQPDKDIVTIEGKHINFKRNEKEYCYLLLYKPIYVLSTTTDPEGRKTVLDLIPHIWKQYRLYPVGRLDFFSEGLLILTNNGSLTYKLTHPRCHIPKIYHVLIQGTPSHELLNTFCKGMKLSDGTQLLPVKTTLLKKQNKNNNCWLELTLYQGVNRQIRKMFQELNTTILKLIRVQQGPLRIGNLTPGMSRPLSNHEIKSLQTF